MRSHSSLLEVEMPPVAEIKEWLAPALKAACVSHAFLAGPYVRADRHGDIRSYDDLDLFIFAEVQGSALERSRSFRDLRLLGEARNVYFSVHVYTQAEAEEYGGPEELVKRKADDWEPVHAAF